ncbi:MAG: ABC transporter substrate-binding protein [Ethanoligenens sp.]
MKHKKHWAYRLGALLLSFTLAGCAAHPSGGASSSSSSKTLSSVASHAAASQTSSAASQAATKPTTFSLPVVFAQDMNPLTTSCMLNLTLWPLLYDCLSQPDTTFTAQKGLASSITNSGTTVTIQLRGGVKFTDGSMLTASDVVYSYNLAKNTPSSYFHGNVSNIAAVNQQGSNTVVFTLAAPDALVENLLDVPIVKSGSGAVTRTPPVGSGPYTFSTSQFSGTLSVNKSWYGGGTFGFQAIALVNMLSTDAVLGSLKIGEINYLYTDYGNGAVPTANLDSKTVNLNRMVFMGVNSAHALTADTHVRRAISFALDRQSLSTDAFSAQALPTDLPYNPDWAGGTKPAAADLNTQLDKAGAELTAAGYTLQDISGIATKAGGANPLQLTLLVNSEDQQMTAAANQIKVSLYKVGIGININAQPFTAYTAALQAGNYDLYLGNLSLTADMDLSPLLVPGGAAAYGVPANSASLSAFNAWRAGGSLSALTAAFSGEMPFIPLCFKTGTVTYTPGLSGSVTPTTQNVFYGIAGWHY